MGLPLLRHSIHKQATMRPIVAFLLAASMAYPAISMAEKPSPTISIGATAMKTHFDESADWGFDCLFLCSNIEIDDDSDAGGELFVKLQWSPLWALKIGYADQGEFDFVSVFVVPEVRGKADVSLAYAAWAPQWNINSRFSLTGAIGAGFQDVDVDRDSGELDIDDGLASYTTLGIQYRASKRLALHTEAGYSIGEDIDVGWIGAGGSYRF